jgi:hypothetical protein
MVFSFAATWVLLSTSGSPESNRVSLVPQTSGLPSSSSPSLRRLPPVPPGAATDARTLFPAQPVTARVAKVYISLTADTSAVPAYSHERTTGIEPASSAWKAEILPLDHVRRRGEAGVQPSLMGLARSHPPVLCPASPGARGVPIPIPRRAAGTSRREEIPAAALRYTGPAFWAAYIYSGETRS